MSPVKFIVQVIRLAGISPPSFPPVVGTRGTPAQAHYRRRLSNAWNQALTDGVAPASRAGQPRRRGALRG